MAADPQDDPTPPLAPQSSGSLRPSVGWGLALSGTIGLVSMWISTRSSTAAALGFSALTMAIVAGLVLANTVMRAPVPALLPGLDLAKGPILRWGIVLYGLRLTILNIQAVGFHALFMDMAIVAITFGLALVLGRRVFGLSSTQAALIGAGSAICGAAAVLATAPVVRSKQDDITVAIATVVGFGTISIFLYPALFPLLHGALPDVFHDAGFGVYAGATIHEVAQVVAVGAAVSEGVTNAAVVTKMVRVILLAPFLMALSAWWVAPVADDAAAPRRKTVPWFAFGFVALVGFNSLDVLPATLRDGLIQLNNLLLATAMAALGLQTRFSTLRRAGLRPMMMAAALYAWLLVGGAGLHVGLHYGLPRLAKFLFG